MRLLTDSPCRVGELPVHGLSLLGNYSQRSRRHRRNSPGRRAEALRDRIHKPSGEELGQVLIQLKTILGYASTVEVCARGRPHRKGLGGGIRLHRA